ncbi:hypothetical protein APR12_004784 [Nocardia amikacinitolerans]|nr:hypothetical protein [Nocardia amikacinitolerans]
MPHSAAADERNGRRPARRSDRRADRPPPGSRRDRIEPQQGCAASGRWAARHGADRTAARARRVARDAPARCRQDRSRCAASRPRRPARCRQDGSGCTASGHRRPGTVPPGRARRGILRSLARCRRDGSRCTASRPRRPGTVPTGQEQVHGESPETPRHGADRTAAGARRVAMGGLARCRRDGRGEESCAAWHGAAGTAAGARRAARDTRHGADRTAAGARRAARDTPARRRQDSSGCTASRPKRPGTAPTGQQRVHGEPPETPRHGADRTAAGARRAARDAPARRRQDSSGCTASRPRHPGTAPTGQQRVRGEWPWAAWHGAAGTGAGRRRRVLGRE